MKVKNITTVLFIAVILTSCAPAGMAVSSTETAVPLPTASPIPPTATFIPTRVPETAVPTIEPIVSLAAEGPWLVYRYNVPSLERGEMGPEPEEFVFLNQDGSGRTLITLYGANTFLMESENAANYMAKIEWDIYVFRPSQATGLDICHQLWYLGCHTFYSGDEKGGLLASFYQASNDVSPELILYELPDGKIHERFPLVQCSKDTNVCEKYRSNWPEMMRQQAQWSPNGRYLAFVAIIDATSSDLFVYDAQNGNLRRMTNGPDWVGPIEWSPDGTQIIMQEILSDDEFLFDPHSKPPASVWSVSVTTNEIKLLYSTGYTYTIQNILLWLDDERFIAYQGFLVDADQARDLRLVDMKAGTNRILFNGVFAMISFDPVHEVFAIYEQNTDYCLPNSICLVSMKDGTIRNFEKLSPHVSFPWWDENTGLFVSSSDCENDPQGLQAFNYQGTARCIPKPAPTATLLETASYPAPNGKSKVSVKGGIWLETDSKPVIPVSQETASDVIWCPDSSCFFFSALQPDYHWNLYHVSLPDLITKLVDEGIASEGTYQWLGVEQ